MGCPENISRLVAISIQAGQDGIDPNEFVRRSLQAAIARRNPFISPDDSFVVLGIDGMDGNIFPCISTKNIEDARKAVRVKTLQEPLYSTKDEVATTFHIFTNEGIHVPFENTGE